MRKRHELNDDSLEHQIGSAEFSASLENEATAQEIALESEFIGTTEYVASSSAIVAKRKPKMSVLSGLAASVAVIVASVVIGITGLINVTMSAVINSFVFEDGLLKYEISATDWTEEESLTLYLYDDDVLVSTYPLERPEQGDTVKGSIALDLEQIEHSLQQGENVSLEYRVTLSGTVGLDVEREFDSYVLKIDKMTSEFRSVTDLACHCSKDGRVHFSLDFTDDYGYFTDFAAYIIDAGGNRFDCEFTDNLHGEQSIYIMEALGSRAEFHLEFKQNNEVQTYSTTIDI